MKSLGQSAILYALSTVLRRLATFLLLPLYTAFLSRSDYGTLETLIVTSQVLTTLFNFGFSNGLIRFHSDCDDDSQFREMARTSIVAILIFSVFSYLITSPLLLWFGREMVGDSTLASRLVHLTCWWAIGGAVNEQIMAWFRARQDAKSYAIVSLAISVLLATLNIIFVRNLGWGVQGVILGNLTVLWLANLVLGQSFWRSGWSLSFGWFRRLLEFGYPLIVSRLSWLVLNSADRYFLVLFATTAEVGTYSLGYRVALLIRMMVIMPFQLAWGPFMFSKAKADSESKQMFSRTLTYLTLAYTLGGLAIYLLRDYLVSFFGSNNYAESVEVVPFILAAYFFLAVYYWSGNFLHLVKKTSLIGLIAGAMAVVNLASNYFLIPEFGWRGAAWSTLITIGGTGLLITLASRRFYSVPFEWYRLGKLFAVVLCIISVDLYVIDNLASGVFVARLLTLLAVPIMLLVVNFLADYEVRFLITQLHNIYRIVPNRLIRANK